MLKEKKEGELQRKSTLKKRKRKKKKENENLGPPRVTAFKPIVLERPPKPVPRSFPSIWCGR